VPAAAGTNTNQIKNPPHESLKEAAGVLRPTPTRAEAGECSPHDKAV